MRFGGDRGVCYLEFVATSGIDLRRLLGASFAVLALGAGIAACGGGDEEEPAAPATTTTGATETVALTTAALIDEGDAICAEVNAALGSIAASTADETTKSSQITDIYDGLAERFGQLGTPSDGEPPTEVIAAARDLADGSTDTSAFTAAAEEYGFTDCAEEPEAVTYSPDPAGPESTSTGTESTETYTPPSTEPTETYTPPATSPAPTTGGGVAPTPPDTGGSTGGSSGGGTSSGGIGPG